jgi:thioredoxin-like negative regulator of GroEL
MNKVTKVSAEWCQPCKQYAPIFEEVTKDMSDEWDIITLDADTDEGTEIINRMGIRGVPATIIERESEEPLILLGPKSFEELKTILAG